MSNTHDDLTRELYRRMNNRDLASLRDKMHTAGEHAPFILAELRRRGISTTPQSVGPGMQATERAQRQIHRPERPALSQRPRKGPQQAARQDARERVLSTLRQFGNQPQTPPGPQPPPPQGRPTPPRTGPRPTPPQARPSKQQRYIPVAKKADPQKKKGCGCLLSIILFILWIVAAILIESSK